MLESTELALMPGLHRLRSEEPSDPSRSPLSGWDLLPPQGVSHREALSSLARDSQLWRAIWSPQNRSVQPDTLEPPVGQLRAGERLPWQGSEERP